MGHVGDELCLQVLGLHLLLHRLLQAGLYIVQLLAVALEVADEVLRVDGRGEVAVRQLFAALLQRPQVQGYIQHRQQFRELQCQKRRGEGAVVVLQEEDEFNKHQYQPRQSCLPDQRQAFGDAPQPQKQRTDNAPEEPGYTPDQRTSQDGARLALGSKGTQEQQHQRHQCRAEEHPAPFIVKRFPANEKRTQQHQQPHVGGYFIQPRQMDALVPCPMASRGHGEAEAEQCQQRE